MTMPPQATQHRPLSGITTDLGRQMPTVMPYGCLLSLHFWQGLRLALTYVSAGVCGGACVLCMMSCSALDLVAVLMS